jgi:hypothetical protein
MPRAQNQSAEAAEAAVREFPRLTHGPEKPFPVGRSPCPSRAPRSAERRNPESKQGSNVPTFRATGHPIEGGDDAAFVAHNSLEKLQRSNGPAGSRPTLT